MIIEYYAIVSNQAWALYFSRLYCLLEKSIPGSTDLSFYWLPRPNLREIDQLELAFFAGNRPTKDNGVLSVWTSQRKTIIELK